MFYSEMRVFFKELLNRTDISEPQVDTFLGLGLRRTERLMRTSMQRNTLYTPITADNLAGFFVPNNYLGLHTMKVNGVLVSRSIDSLAPLDSSGSPDEYFIHEGKFKFRPGLKVGDIAELVYYAEFQEVGSDPNVATPATVILPDIIVYAALGYAADFFMDVRKEAFKATFGELLTELQDLSDRDEMSGGMAVSNPYAGMC